MDSDSNYWSGLNDQKEEGVFRWLDDKEEVDSRLNVGIRKWEKQFK